MGAANIVQNSIKQSTQSFWNKIPKLPSIKPLNFDLSTYNQSFVNFAIVFGILAVAKSTYSLAKTVVKSGNKVPTKEQLLNKYGYLSWGLIANCKDNQDYSIFLAKNGFNLILLGEKNDIERTRDIVVRINPNILIESREVNWGQVQIDLRFYEQLVNHLQKYDISFLVLPKLKQQKDEIPSHLEKQQPFQHIYLLVRYFGVKLKFRSYRSAIIFPSYKDAESISTSNGVTHGLIAGSDAFGRIISYELKGTVEVVVARGSVQNAFAGLGLQKITY